MSRRARVVERALSAVVRGEVYIDDVHRGIYATDASHYQVMPACVVVPRDEADCMAAVKTAAEFGLPITPRGGATALSGQTFGSGVVVDVSKYMDQVLELNVEERWARVQPGLVADVFNASLAEHGLFFAPDPATGNRATIGGMIGNNSSGMRSVVHGKTIDHVISCKVALADGTVMELDAADAATWQKRSEGDSREAGLYRGVKDLIDTNRAEVLARYPKVMRRVSGYNLDEFVDGAGYTGSIGGRNLEGHRTWNLSNLVVGSEGTLAFVLEACVRLTPLPGARGLCVVHFKDEIDSLRHIPAILEHGPSAIELLDDVVISEALVNPSTRDMTGFIEGHPKAVLICEMSGTAADDVARQMDALVRDLKERGIGYAWPEQTDPATMANVWAVRKLGLGLISNVKGPVKGQAVIEDACIPVEHLAEYTKRLQQVCSELEVRSSVYAHASVGVLHFRPMLDLHLPEHREKMVAIANSAFDMVVEYGGIFAGEHGDGIVRGGFIPRFFGPRLYEAFRELKRLFDPDNLMNPGKVIDVPPMTSLLRYGDQYHDADAATLFHYREQGGFQLAVEQCNGVGACRKVDDGTMCPSFMATRDESASTRGRANALRLAMSGQLGKDALGSDEIKAVLDLCLACKACKSECPNSVDMARLKSDVLQMHHDAHGVPLGYRMVGGMPGMARVLAGPLAPLVNAVSRLPLYGWFMEKVAGMDRRRPQPPFAVRPLASLLKARPKRDCCREGDPSTSLGMTVSKSPSSPGNCHAELAEASPLSNTDSLTKTPSRTHSTRVVLFDDTYANYLEPRVGLSAVELLEGCGYEVILARAGCCQRPRLSKGLVRTAKKHGTKTMEKLDVFAREGLPIICLEPSCASALKDDLPDLIDDVELGARVAGRIVMIDAFLEAEVLAGNIPPLAFEPGDYALHGHCHQKSVFGTAAIHSHFGRTDDATCEEVDSGCCGMAGSFGYEHYDLSVQVGEERLFPAVRKAVAEGKTILACGISCRHQLHDALGVGARHWVEVVRPGQERR
ncbi:MAG: FAD-binding and (Fe-S)-binding domain-containing protein [Kiritimatiellia bacterium]|nr:FAD-binding and (Fe-S)-binding domain-containing protein [Kiritimatiellia bacterium]MDP6809909.1 FAD-binding and (Fe-S)-binding domain-containing protein [Kiritimatiellia bacterium]